MQAVAEQGGKAEQTPGALFFFFPTDSGRPADYFLSEQRSKTHLLASLNLLETSSLPYPTSFSVFFCWALWKAVSTICWPMRLMGSVSGPIKGAPVSR